jgi:exodeoxyribonuclease VII large subunit
MSKIYTVTEFSCSIKDFIDELYEGQLICISGELTDVSTYKQMTFMKLKENDVILDLSCFDRTINVKKYENSNVKIYGIVNYFHKKNCVKVNVKKIDMLGNGLKNSLYEKLYIEYESKGYFNNRKVLPKNIKNIGIITSINSGIVFRDFIYMLEKNKFNGNVFMYNCYVQGVQCAESVAKGLEFFEKPFKIVSYIDYKKIINTQNIVNDNNDINDNDNDKDKDNDKDNDNINVIDIIIVMRGGGSHDDLAGFNEPIVIEAIHSSTKYVMTAIGHEADTTLADRCSNYQAPTPSAAGEVVTEDMKDKYNMLKDVENKLISYKHNLLNILHKFKDRLNDICLDDPKNRFIKIEQSITEHKNSLLNILHRYKSRIDKIQLNEPTKYLCDKVIQEGYNIKQHLNKMKTRLDTINKCLVLHDVTNILKNGFNIMVDVDNNVIIDIGKMFDKPIKMIHSTGTYKVIIEKIEN